MRGDYWAEPMLRGGKKIQTAATLLPRTVKKVFLKLTFFTPVTG